MPGTGTSLHGVRQKGTGHLNLVIPGRTEDDEQTEREFPGIYKEFAKTGFCRRACRCQRAG